MTVVEPEELGLLSVYLEGRTDTVPWESQEKVRIPGQHFRKPLVIDKYSGMTVVSEEVGMYTSITSKEFVCNTTFINLQNLYPWRSFRLLQPWRRQ